MIQGPTPTQPTAPAPPEDYAQARAGFKTTLLESGPSPRPEAPLETPEGAKLIEYRSGGLTLKAFVGPTFEDGQTHPAVLFLHGGFAFGTDDWNMPRPYRDAGYVVMVPILRGENGQDGAFTLYYDEVDDVLAAAEALSNLPGVDPNRLFLAGHSAGGTLTLLAAMTSNRFRAAAAFSATTDLRILKEVPALIRFDPKSNQEFALRSPQDFATSFKCPTRLYAGNQETLLSQQAQNTARQAHQAGLDVEAVENPGDHFTSLPVSIGQSLQFFQGK